MRQHLYRYLMVTLGCVLMGIAINAFYMPNKLISGGIGGVSVILYYLIGLPMGITSLLLNIPLFVAAYKFMDRSYIVSALYGMLVFSVSLDAFHFLAEKAPYVHDPMLACIAGGVIYGIGAAMMYRVGGSSGGTDIIGAIINKHYSISIGTTGFMFNIILMFIGVFYFGLEAVLYTLLAFFVMFKTCNAFTDGFDYKKNIIIISEHYEEIGNGIIEVIGRGVTYLYAEGAYTHQQRKVLFSCCQTYTGRKNQTDRTRY
ncbi:MAG: YitT family protein [Phascolarctobacterium faecium]